LTDDHEFDKEDSRAAQNSVTTAGFAGSSAMTSTSVAMPALLGAAMGDVVIDVPREGRAVIIACLRARNRGRGFSLGVNHTAPGGTDTQRRPADWVNGSPSAILESAAPVDKTRVARGRRIEWRAKWARDWGVRAVLLRRPPPPGVTEWRPRLEAAILALLADRSAGRATILDLMLPKRSARRAGDHRPARSGEIGDSGEAVGRAWRRVRPIALENGEAHQRGPAIRTLNDEFPRRSS
jgi:hypothetical protein